MTIYQSTKTAKIFLVTLDMGMHGTSLQAASCIAPPERFCFSARMTWLPIGRQ